MASAPKIATNAARISLRPTWPPYSLRRSGRASARPPAGSRPCAAPSRRPTSVAPVVQTSSTSSASRGASAVAQTAGGSASRSERRRPTWRRPPAAAQARAQGHPGRARPLAIAISSAGSNPRQRQRQGPAGTGTTPAAARRSGSARSIASAATPASASLRANFSPWTTNRATPSKGEATTARSTPGGPGLDHPRSRGELRLAAAHRGPTSSGRAEPQAAQSGGAASEAICSIRRIRSAHRPARSPREARALPRSRVGR